MTMRCVLSLLTLSLLLPTPARSAEPREWAQSNLEPLLEVYRHLHQNPELSLHEAKTSEFMAKELKAVGAEVSTGVGGFGLVGLLKNGDGPTIMVRTKLPTAITLRGMPSSGTAKLIARQVATTVVTRSIVPRENCRPDRGA